MDAIQTLLAQQRGDEIRSSVVNVSSVQVELPSVPDVTAYWWCGRTENCPVGLHPDCAEITQKALDGDYPTVAEEYGIDVDALEQHLRNAHFRKDPVEQQAEAAYVDAQQQLIDKLQDNPTELEMLDGMTRLLLIAAIQKLREASPIEAARLNKEIRENIIARARLRKEIVDTPQITNINVHQQQLNLVLKRLEERLPQDQLMEFFGSLEGGNPDLEPDMDLPEIMALPAQGASRDYLASLRRGGR